MQYAAQHQQQEGKKIAAKEQGDEGLLMKNADIANVNRSSSNRKDRILTVPHLYEMQQ